MLNQCDFWILFCKNPRKSAFAEGIRQIRVPKTQRMQTQINRDADLADASKRGQKRIF